MLTALVGCQAAPEPPAPARPNILFAIADDVSFPHMSAYGTSWVSTPAFDRVAREGLLFTRAYVPNAKCAPSRSIILTGRHSWQLEQAANHWPFFPARFRTWAEVLNESGYHVGFTGKGWGPGVARDAQGEPRQLAGAPWQEHQAEPPAAHVSRIDYAANFAAFLDARPQGEPFSFWYGGTEPHRAYAYGAGLRGGRQPSDVDAVPVYWPDTEEVRTDMLDYAFEIEHFDTQLGRMLRLLEERGELENTLVVVTSDNGMPFPRVKGNVYEAANHMPLAVMWPAGIDRPGRTVDDLVSFVDFAPTFLEVAGLAAGESGMAAFAGRSLTALFDGAAAAWRAHLLLGKERHDVGRPGDAGYPGRAIVKDGWLYIVNFEPDRWPAGNPETGYLNTDGSPTKTQILEMRRRGEDDRYWRLAFGKRPAEELYRLEDDPDCALNLAGVAAHDAIRETLRRQLFEELEAQGDPRVRGAGAVFDSYLYSDERSRGFYERYMAGEEVNSGWVEPTDFEEKPLESHWRRPPPALDRRAGNARLLRSR